MKEVKDADEDWKEEWGGGERRKEAPPERMLSRQGRFSEERTAWQKAV